LSRLTCVSCVDEAPNPALRGCCTREFEPFSSVSSPRLQRRSRLAATMHGMPRARLRNLRSWPACFKARHGAGHLGKHKLGFFSRSSTCRAACRAERWETGWEAQEASAAGQFPDVSLLTQTEKARSRSWGCSYSLQRPLLIGALWQSVCGRAGHDAGAITQL
jgi:hypothetical protein